MLSICSETRQPFFNLATEEYYLQNRKEDFVILSINDPCVIIGKHQVVHKEVNTKFIEDKNIPVLRRISGGGAVYHDAGNLNFAFIKQSETGKQVDFRLYTKPVIDFLNSVGVNALFEGKNDITVEGLKISGNAEHVFKERVLHHGTLLFDASLDDLRLSLKAKSDNYSTRAVESNRTSVSNLKGRLQNIADINDFKASFQDFIMNKMSDIQTYIMTKEERSAIHQLADTKYKTWEWNYGYGPAYTFNNWFESEGKAYRCRLMVKDGIIWECDFEGSDEMKTASKKLIGCRHMYQDLLKKFREENIPVTIEELYRFF
jgi:lipoate---protein ligase